MWRGLGQVVAIPPLRERVESIPLLVENFLRVYGRNTNKIFADETLELLKQCRWELNVRQLQLVVERAVCLVDREVVLPEDIIEFVTPLHEETGEENHELDADRFPPLRDVVKEVERKHILRALEITEGNRKEAIALLQLSAEKYYKRLKEYGINEPPSRPPAFFAT